MRERERERTSLWIQITEKDFNPRRSKNPKGRKKECCKWNKDQIFLYRSFFFDSSHSFSVRKRKRERERDRERERQREREEETRNRIEITSKEIIV